MCCWLIFRKQRNPTVMVTKEGTKTVQEVKHHAQGAIDSFASVRAAVDSAYQSAMQITLNVKQQAKAVKPCYCCDEFAQRWGEGNS